MSSPNSVDQMPPSECVPAQQGKWQDYIPGESCRRGAEILGRQQRRHCRDARVCWPHLANRRLLWWRSAGAQAPPLCTPCCRCRETCSSSLHRTALGFVHSLVPNPLLPSWHRIAAKAQGLPIALQSRFAIDAGHRQVRHKCRICNNSIHQMAAHRWRSSAVSLSGRPLAAQRGQRRPTAGAATAAAASPAAAPAAAAPAGRRGTHTRPRAPPPLSARALSILKARSAP